MSYTIETDNDLILVKKGDLILHTIKNDKNFNKIKYKVINENESRYDFINNLDSSYCRLYLVLNRNVPYICYSTYLFQHCKIVNLLTGEENTTDEWFSPHFFRAEFSYDQNFLIIFNKFGPYLHNYQCKELFDEDLFPENLLFNNASESEEIDLCLIEPYRTSGYRYKFSELGLIEFIEISEEESNYPSFDGVKFSDISKYFEKVGDKYIANRYIFRTEDEKFKLLIPESDLFKINSFLDHILKYKDTLQGLRYFFNDTNILKWIISKKVTNQKIIVDSDCNDEILKLKQDDIKYLEVYLGSDRCYYGGFWLILCANYDNDIAHELFGKNNGYGDLTRGIFKERLPNGVNMKFIIITVNNRKYEYKFHMNLVELEPNLVFYNQEISILTATVRRI